MPFDTEKSYIKRVGKAPKGVPISYYFQEESKAWTFPSLLKGHIFTFDYYEKVDESNIPPLSDYVDAEKRKQYSITRPYFDSKPIGIALGSLDGSGDEYILNLKPMPTVMKANVLEVLFKGAIPVIEKYGLDPKDLELKPLTKRVADFNYIRPFAELKAHVFSNYLGEGIYFWVNKYKKEWIRNVKLIDFDVLEKISLSNYNYDKFIRTNGYTVEDIQKFLLMNTAKKE
jgi:hypothetical protein